MMTLRLYDMWDRTLFTKPDGWWNAFDAKKKKGKASFNGSKAKFSISDLKGRS